MDITMCKGNNCDLAKNCIRHIAQPNEYRQAYFTIEPNTSSTECKYYDEYEPQHLTSCWGKITINPDETTHATGNNTNPTTNTNGLL
jgi:hypothetical protein